MDSDDINDVLDIIGFVELKLLLTVILRLVDINSAFGEAVIVSRSRRCPCLGNSTSILVCR